MITTFFLFLSSLIAQAQTIEVQRVTNWNLAGVSTPIEPSANQVSILDFGGDPSGISNNFDALQNALASLNGQPGTVYFPDGDYLFNNTITIPNNLFLVGESTQTLLRFNLGGNGHLIQFVGNLGNTEYALLSRGNKGGYELDLEHPEELQVGQYLRIFQNDEDLVASDWALGTVGQVVRIESINGNTVTLADPLNQHYPLDREPYVRPIVARSNSGISCLRLKREDATAQQTSNIYMSNAANCKIENVESSNCNFAHIEINSSAHIQIEGCYFHDAFAYGGGGQGYGVALQTTSSFCLVENNTFDHLRHSMLLQSGANGNVFGYNYSYDAYWTEGGQFPTNSAGDAVLHGNYPYLNLFEGNTIQNIVVDASHESNGPFNTFFRNRAQLYGFVSDPNTPTDSMNVVGNEITSTGFPFGLFVLNGNGHYSYGNNVYGTADPTNTTNLSTLTLYLNESQLPGYLSEETLPMVGYPLALNEKLIQAQLRFDTGIPVNCTGDLITDASSLENDAETNVSLMANELRINSSLLPASIAIYSVDGKLIWTSNSTIEVNELPLLPNNQLLIVEVTSKNGTKQTRKFANLTY